MWNYCFELVWWCSNVKSSGWKAHTSPLKESKFPLKPLSHDRHYKTAFDSCPVVQRMWVSLKVQFFSTLNTVPMTFQKYSQQSDGATKLKRQCHLCIRKIQWQGVTGIAFKKNINNQRKKLWHSLPSQLYTALKQERNSLSWEGSLKVNSRTKKSW